VWSTPVRSEIQRSARAGQRLGGCRGLIDRGHPAVSRHDPLLIVNAAHVRLVDELSAALEPGDRISVDLRRLHLSEVGRNDAEDKHHLSVTYSLEARPSTAENAATTEFLDVLRLSAMTR